MGWLQTVDSGRGDSKGRGPQTLLARFPYALFAHNHKEFEIDAPGMQRALCQRMNPVAVFSDLQ